MALFGVLALLLAGLGCTYMGWRRRRTRPMLAWSLIALGVAWLAAIAHGIVQDVQDIQH